MVYVWRCDDCKKTTEITRPLAEHNVPPDIQGHGPWTKVIVPVAIASTERRDSCYPAQVKVGTEVVTFLSKRHQDQWMNQNGYVRTADVCDDDSFNDSQHSIFDKLDPPPNAEAEDLLKLCQWVDQSTVESDQEISTS